MDETVFVMLLLTGFFVPSASFPYVYYFIREQMTWDDAQNYCITEHTEMAQILYEENVTTMMNTPTGGYADKAWIGLSGNISEWTWVDGQAVTYSSWGPDQPKNTHANEFCVYMTSNGTWTAYSCSENKHAACLKGESNDSWSLFFTEKQMTWTEAKKYCEDKSSILAIVSDKTADSKIQNELLDYEQVWIGLNRPKVWYWSGTVDTGENYTFMNWKPGQPDNLNQAESCAAAMVTDGTWTHEDCSAAYPFFCYGIYKSKKTMVRMTILSSANMEDPTYSADLQQQLYAALVNQGVTDFRLTWRKLPVPVQTVPAEAQRMEVKNCYIRYQKEIT